MSILAGPSNPEADFRVTVDQPEKALRILRPQYDHVLVDCGSRLDPRTLWMLEQADTHVFVIFPEIAALRASTPDARLPGGDRDARATTHFVVNHIFPKELLRRGTSRTCSAPSRWPRSLTQRST